MVEHQDEIEDGHQSDVSTEKKQRGRQERKTKKAQAGDHRCEKCDKSFNSASYLKIHVATHDGARPFICEECPKSFTQKTALMRHKKNHLLEKPYKCDICQKGFTRSEHLVEHRTIHTGEKLFGCPECGKRYRNHAQYYVHMKRHRSSGASATENGAKLAPSRTYECEICSKKYSSWAGLYIHKKTHAPEKPFKCQFCSKTFLYANSLPDHMRIHTGEKPFLCGICSEQFASRSSFYRHEKTHTEAKLYKCTVCGKCFALKRYLTSHLKRHAKNGVDEGAQEHPLKHQDKEDVADTPMSLVLNHHQEIQAMVASAPLYKNSHFEVPMAVFSKSNSSSSLTVIPSSSSEEHASSKTRSYLVSHEVGRGHDDDVQPSVPGVSRDQEDYSSGSHTQEKTVHDKEIILVQRESPVGNVLLKESESATLKVTSQELVIEGDSVSYQDDNEGITNSNFEEVEPGNEHSSPLFLSARPHDLPDDVKLDKTDLKDTDVVMTEEMDQSFQDPTLSKKTYTAKEKAHHGWKCEYCMHKFTSVKSFKNHLEKEHPEEVLLDWTEDERPLEDGKTMPNIEIRFARPHDVEEKGCEVVESDDHQYVDSNIESEEGLGGEHDELDKENGQQMAEEPTNLKLPPRKRIASAVCPHCQKVLKTQFQLRRHLKQEHGVLKPFSCRLCDGTFERHSLLVSHRKKHHGPDEAKPHVCDTCSRSFDTPEQLANHIRIHTGEKPFMCDLCSKSYPLLVSLQNHMKTHTKPNQCDICQARFARVGELKKHQLIHTAELPADCQVCGKSNCQDLEHRKQSIQKLFGYKCDICHKVLAERSTLNRHMRSHTGEKPYMCDLCGKSFARSRYLVDHRAIHTGEKHYTCAECGKGFRTCTGFYLHKRNHLPAEKRLKYVQNTDGTKSVKKYKCDQCGKRLNSSGALYTHKKFHSEDRPHKCRYCTKAYHMAQSLRIHERGHTGERPYQCGVCGKSYTSSSVHRKHMRTHTLLKPFKCDVCGKDFALAKYLSAHRKTHGGAVASAPAAGEPDGGLTKEQRAVATKCEVCDKRFASSAALRKHRKKHPVQDDGGTAFVNQAAPVIVLGRGHH